MSFKIYFVRFFPDFIVKSASKFKRKLTRFFTKPISFKELNESFVGAGILPGHNIYLLSAFSSIGNYRGGPKAFIDDLISYLGKSSTLSFPCHLNPKKVFDAYDDGFILDLRTELPQTGIIPSLVLTSFGGIRSSHPFGSTVSVGPRSKYLTENHDANHKLCHPDSPLSRLLDLDSKLIGIGTDFAAMSFYHLVEDLNEYIYPVYLDSENIKYIDFKGKLVERKVSRYNPCISYYRIERPGGHESRIFLKKYLEDNSIINYFTIGNAKCWVMDANILYSHLMKLYKENITIYSSGVVKCLK